MSSNNIPQAPTAETTIVFPLTSDYKKFNSGFYTPALTDGKASKEEISQFFAEIEVYQRVSAQETGPFIQRLLFVVFLVFFCMNVGYLIQNNMSVMVILLAVLGYLILVDYIMTIVVQRFRNIRNQVKDKCQTIAYQHNQYLGPRGLRWSIPADFPKKVELWKEYNQNQGIDVIPVIQQGNAPVQNYELSSQNSQGQGNNNSYTPPSQF